MKQRYAAPAIMVITALAVLLVFAYNLWSYCCGRCSAATFLTLGPFGYTLLGLNLAAAGILLFLKCRHRARYREQRCSCGTVMAAEWRFCPCCGGPDRTARLQGTS